MSARTIRWATVLSVLIVWPGPLPAADHGDTPFLQSIGRHDARVTDLFAFTRGGNLVLILNSNPAIPASVTDYRFSSDLEFEISLDNHSTVSPDDPDNLGGTVLHPDRISEDVSLRIRFDPSGTPKVEVKTRGCRDARGIREDLRFFAGLRDDPFIRAPRVGRNVAALVLEVPLASVLDGQSTLLIWAHSRILRQKKSRSDIADSAGTALRSMFPENDDLNVLSPSQQFRRLGVAPDVIIFDTDLPASYPNGRELTDDVIDLVGDPRTLADDAPFPDTNDVGFGDDFPYLAEPHAP